jgi:hypothetical protein
MALKSNRGFLVLLPFLFALNTSCSRERVEAGFPDSESGTEPETLGVPYLEFDVAYSEAFSYLNGVRELSDGRVMAADPLGQVVLRIDLDSGTADTLGSVGPGPQEYMQPDQVLQLSGDSTLLVDFGKTYLTVLGPEGIFADGRSMMVPSETGFPGLMHPRFGDREGRIYFQPSRRQGDGPPDSAGVTRFGLESQAQEDVASFWAPEVEQIQTPGHGFLPRLLEPRDDWAVGPDGRVALIRAKDYSVAWHHPDGRVVMGPPNPVEVLALNRRIKEAYIPDMRADGISMWSSSSRSGGEVRMGMRRGLSNEGPGVDDFQWAETLPVFRPDRTRVSLEGEAWVERWLPPDSTPRMDVFDEIGNLTGSIPLPPGRQLLGFGRGPRLSGSEHRDGEVAYLVLTDEYDLKWLERYRVIRNSP